MTINASIPTDIEVITGDDSQIRQIVMNLIINAAEAIGEKQGVVLVSLTRTDITEDQLEKDYLGKRVPPGEYLCLKVTDNGCGMDDETKRRIFEPFYTTKFTGRGLGMSAVMGIINAHNGAIQLISEAGQGTIFKVFLPIQLNKSAIESSLQMITDEQWQGSGTILLVEDEEQVKSIASALLENSTG